jgi:hypothetical protein
MKELAKSTELLRVGSNFFDWFSDSFHNRRGGGGDDGGGYKSNPN